MNIIKWLRKNNTKVMAVVVIVLMVAFIGGSALTYALRGSGGLNKPMAYFGDGAKITPYDQMAARQELDLLRAVGAGTLLQSQDLRGVLLGELLFSEGKGSPALVNALQRSVRTNQYRISDKQIEDMYARTMPGEFYWMLLTNEAQAAGMRVQNRDVAEWMGAVIPRLFEGRTYTQVMTQLVSRYGVAEGQVLTTLGKLLAVLQYAHIACSMENVTGKETAHIAGRESETIDVEFVRFDPNVFFKSDGSISEQDIAAQFDKYKKYSPGELSADNPCGFGYKLPDRVQLEYIAVKLDDVTPTVAAPTEEDAEDYYRKNRDRLFTEEVSKDPNDPNSLKVKRTKSYAEVAASISEGMLRDRVNSKAEQILQEAKNLADAGLTGATVTDVNLTVEKLKSLAGDYDKVAQQVAGKYGVKVYTGRTGLLSGVDMQTDVQLGRLYVTVYGQNPLRLSQVVFSVEADEQPRPTSGQKTRMYESIGPVRDPIGQMRKDTPGEILAMVRVVDIQKAREPEDVDISFSTKTLELGTADAAQDKKVFSVRQKVVDDLKRLAALDVMKSKAAEFTTLAKSDGWDKALAKFNELYGKHTTREANEPNAFRLETLAGLRRVSIAWVEMVAAQNAGNPALGAMLNEAGVERLFIDQVYALIPQDSNTVKATPLVFEFKPNLSLYCVKTLSVRRLTLQEYESTKSRIVNRQDQIESESLAAVHFNPESIVKRMNFRWAEKPAAPVEAPRPLDLMEEI